MSRSDDAQGRHRCAGQDRTATEGTACCNATLSSSEVLCVSGIDCSLSYPWSGRPQAVGFPLESRRFLSGQKIRDTRDGSDEAPFAQQRTLRLSNAVRAAASVLEKSSLHVHWKVACEKLEEARLLGRTEADWGPDRRPAARVSCSSGSVACMYCNAGSPGHGVTRTCRTCLSPAPGFA